MEGTKYSLQGDLDDVRRQLRNIQTAIEDRLLTLKESIPLTVPLLGKETRLIEEIKALNPIAPTAPPGNSISLPKVVPIPYRLSLLSFPSSVPPQLQLFFLNCLF